MVSTSGESFTKISPPSEVLSQQSASVILSTSVGLQTGCREAKQVKHVTVVLELHLEELIWCSSSGSPRSVGRSAGLGPPPGWSSPPPPPQWCHTVRSGGGAHVVQPCRHKLWPETGGTPPSPKAADGQGACPCWSPWWTVAQMWGWWSVESEALE